MAVSSLTERKKRIRKLLDELEAPVTMSMHVSRDELHADLMRQRKEAADLLREVLES